MFRVYRYVDLNDLKTKYVGITEEKRGGGLKKRCLEHFRKDVWSHGKFNIGYIEVDTKTDAEFLESFFISEYGTDKYFNIAKSKWGSSKFVDTSQFRWKTYVEYDNNLTAELIRNHNYYSVDTTWNYKIWQGKNGKWYTYFPDAIRGRKLVKRVSKKRLEEAIREFREKAEILKGLK